MKRSIAVIFVLTSAWSWGQKNLVRNGGFEGSSDNWRGEGVIINAFDRHDGNSAGMINQFTGGEWKGIDQIITVPKDCYAFDFGVWMKADNIEGGKDPWNAGVMTVELLTAGEKSIRYEGVAEVLGSTGWVYYHKSVVLPAEAKKIRIILALAQTNGSLLFDNVSAVGYSVTEFEKMKEEERKAAKLAAQSFRNGSFEMAMEGWRGAAILVSDPVKEGAAAVSITSSQPVWTGIDQPAFIPEGSKKVKVSGWLRAQSLVRGKESWNNGVFIIELTKDGTTKAIDDQMIGSVVGDSDWTYFEKELDLPAGAEQFRLLLALSNATGTLYADDIRVTFSK